MKSFIAFIVLGITLASCVPAKKYNELLEKEKQCSDELAKYKNDAQTFEASSKDFHSK